MADECGCSRYRVAAHTEPGSYGSKISQLSSHKVVRQEQEGEGSRSPVAVLLKLRRAICGVELKLEMVIGRLMAEKAAIREKERP